MSDTLYRNFVAAYEAKKRRDRTERLAGCAYSIGESAVHALILGWILMLVVGMLHREWWPAMPPIGFWWAAITAGALRGLFTPQKPYKKAVES